MSDHQAPAQLYQAPDGDEFPAKILIVEDDPIQAQILAMRVEHLRYVVLPTVTSAEQALEIIPEELPDLVLLDIHLGGEMNGVEAAREIRTRWDIPVVFATADPDEELLEQAKVTQPFGYLLKPIQANQLRVTLSMALYTASLEQERKLTEERLRHVERMDAMGQLASGIAHDFNNQLGAILGYADLLISQLEDEELQSYARNISRAASLTSRLTNQLLTFSHRSQQEVTPVDIHLVIAEAVAILTRTIDKKIQVKTRLNAKSSTIMGDPIQLQNALLNLGLNARDAMPNGGELVFSTAVVPRLQPGKSNPSPTPPTSELQVLVSDTGYGMSEQTSEHIFEPFFTTKEPGSGTGLGLATVSATIARHGGFINVSSAPGEGSVFILNFPLTDPTECVPPPDEKVTPAASLSMLVLDDEPAMCDIIGKMLAELGHKVMTCIDPEAAIELYRQSWKEIDLVVLDLVMPKLSGTEVFAAMKQINPRVKAVIATGFSSQHNVNAALDEGVLEILHKPFRLSTLSRVIERVGHKAKRKQKKKRKPTKR